MTPSTTVARRFVNFSMQLPPRGTKWDTCATMSVAGLWSERTGRPVHRLVVVAVGVAAVALLLMGAALVIYSFAAVDHAV